MPLIRTLVATLVDCHELKSTVLEFYETFWLSRILPRLEVEVSVRDALPAAAFSICSADADADVDGLSPVQQECFYALLALLRGSADGPDLVLQRQRCMERLEGSERSGSDPTEGPGQGLLVATVAVAACAGTCCDPDGSLALRAPFSYEWCTPAGARAHECLRRVATHVCTSGAALCGCRRNLLHNLCAAPAPDVLQVLRTEPEFQQQLYTVARSGYRVAVVAQVEEGDTICTGSTDFQVSTTVGDLMVVTLEERERRKLIERPMVYFGLLDATKGSVAAFVEAAEAWAETGPIRTLAEGTPQWCSQMLLSCTDAGASVFTDSCKCWQMQ